MNGQPSNYNVQGHAKQCRKKKKLNQIMKMQNQGWCVHRGRDIVEKEEEVKPDNENAE